MTDKLKSCPWCHNHKHKTELQFSVIDDDFGRYVNNSMINYCPFCGRKLRENNADKENLTQLICKGITEYSNSTLKGCLDEYLADYLLENGVIAPPCKVGDVVWFDTYKKNGTVSLGIQPHKVDRIDVICVVGEKELIETKLHDWYFGESVFLTKEEAEEKLKGLK